MAVDGKNPIISITQKHIASQYDLLKHISAIGLATAADGKVDIDLSVKCLNGMFLKDKKREPRKKKGIRDQVMYYTHENGIQVNDLKHVLKGEG